MGYDPYGNLIVTDWETALAMSPGSWPAVVAGRAQGYVNTSATTSTPVRATTYTVPASVGQCSFKSSSANDTSAGTGAQSITVNYLDSSFALHAETLSLNGTSAVNTVGTNYAYIESIMVASIGSGGVNAGVISMFVGAGGTGATIGSIAVGDQQTWWAHHYVPTGVTCYVLCLNSGANGVQGISSLIHTPGLQTVGAPVGQVGTSVAHPIGQWDHEFQVPITLPGPDLIYVLEQPQSSTTSKTVAGFEYLQF
jgi:hypothetical protein